MTAYAIWLSIIRATHIGACLVALAAAVFDRWMIGRDSPAVDLARVTWRPIERSLLLVAGAIAVAAGLVWFGFVVADLTDTPLSHVFVGSNAAIVLRATHFGRLSVWRLIAWLIGAIGWVLAGRTGAVANVARWITLTAAVFLVGSLAWIGHGQMGTDRGWHVFVDASHLLIAAVWPGGLLPLTLALARLWRAEPQLRSTAIAEIVSRFSPTALWSVIVLTATGVANAWTLLRGPRDLISTAYGGVLLVKMSLFAGMVMLGAINRYRCQPKIERGDDPIAVLQLRRNVWIELLLAVAVTLAIGVLGMLAPPACCPL